MTHLITPPAVLRDPFVDQPETRESGDQIYHITLEFSAIEAVRPLIKQIEKLMPKNGASPLRVLKTEAGRVWRIKLRRPDQPKVLGPDLGASLPGHCVDGRLPLRGAPCCTSAAAASGATGRRASKEEAACEHGVSPGAICNP